MTRLKPFRAIIYNQEKIKDLSLVTSPPYDVVSPQRQKIYHERSPYNFLHILLGKDLPGEDKYQRAADSFKDWLKEGVMRQEENPAIYFYTQQYTLRGEKRRRFGFVCLLHLGEAFGHEHTYLEPKEDRLRLLEAVRANLSPIFVLFLDKKRIIRSIYQRYIANGKPCMELTDDEKIVHKIFRLEAPEIISQIQSKMAEESIFIADGHHRYEVACAYRDKMAKKIGACFSGEEDFNYILAYFTNTQTPDLTILAIHRLVRLVVPIEIKTLLTSLEEYFHIEGMKDKAKLFFMMEKAGRREHVFGMYYDKTYWLLRLKNIKIVDKFIKGNWSSEYKTVDVAILNSLVLETTLKMDLEDKQRLCFTPDAEEAIAAVDVGDFSLAFFLNPVKVGQIISLALNAEKIPPKSTYFYPKVLSGLLINKHADGPLW